MTSAPRTGGSIWSSFSTDPVQTAQRHIQSLHEQLAKATLKCNEKDEQLAAVRLENEALRRAVEQKDSELFNAQSETARLRKRTEALQVHVAELELQMQSARRLNAGLSERLCLEEMEMEAEAVLGRVKAAKAELLAATASVALAPLSHHGHAPGGAAGAGGGGGGILSGPGSAASGGGGGGGALRSGPRGPGQTLSWKLLGERDSNGGAPMGAGGGRRAGTSEKSDEGDGDTFDGINTRKANSTAFDTMSNASVNTEDGAGTYTNSEYTSHLGVLSDEDAEDDDDHKPAANGRIVRGERK